MIDIVTPAVRSRMMSGIRGTNTKPELLLRRELHRRGFRFRLHDRKLPGCPDIVLPKWHAVIFAHGCFWHGHDCPLFRWPATRPDFWRNKILQNKKNDLRSDRALKKDGWRIAAVWECALKGAGRRDINEVIDLCTRWIKSDRRTLEIRGHRK
jgi:DNA mismatch endonuclease, patch repair protein